MEEDEAEQICSTHRQVEEWKQNCSWKGRDHLSRLSDDGNVILNWALRK